MTGRKASLLQLTAVQPQSRFPRQPPTHMPSGLPPGNTSLGQPGKKGRGSGTVEPSQGARTFTTRDGDPNFPPPSPAAEREAVLTLGRPKAARAVAPRASAPRRQSSADEALSEPEGAAGRVLGGGRTAGLPRNAPCPPGRPEGVRPSPARLPALPSRAEAAWQSHQPAGERLVAPGKKGRGASLPQSHPSSAGLQESSRQPTLARARAEGMATTVRGERAERGARGPSPRPRTKPAAAPRAAPRKKLPWFQATSP
ncbi:uncharacterized protein LOC114056282 [Empidonax traillii]|uniref:uncharacterized protein LOC114056282 n=1 Tax=Empidonax traillii TaxID=164674 RepID=UPI000FFD5EDE|nr:uncharacterized protein LOC114056282 [Empidonax traillii]